MGKHSVNRISLHDNLATKPAWYVVQACVKEKLCGKYDTSQFHREALSKLSGMLQRTVSMAESNSVLIIGPRASGKSTLINKAIEQLYDLNSPSAFSVVKLNGIIQNTDNVTLKEIANQLQVEAQFDEINARSALDILTQLLETFRVGSAKSRGLIFVLDEFDIFAERKNQLLLYNLFDISQSKQIPISVIGLTCRLDVTELLEKRVKSRYSFRQIHLFLDVTYDQYKSTFVDLLSVKLQDEADRKYIAEWNENIRNIAANPVVEEILANNYLVSKSIRVLQTIIMYPIGCINAVSPHLKVGDFIESQKMMSVDDRTQVLCGLSLLELCLLVSIKHLSELRRNEPFNLMMVHNHYDKHLGKVSSIHHFKFIVIAKAFEHLEALELIQSVDNKSVNEYRLYRLLLEPYVIDEAVKAYSGLPYDIINWATSNAIM